MLSISILKTSREREREMCNAAVRTKESSPNDGTTDAISKDIYKLVSFEEIKKMAKRILNGDIDTIKYTIRPYSDGKVGFLGSHYQLRVIASTHGSEPIAFSLFVKAVPYEVPTHTEYVMNMGVFKHETRFYNVILPLLGERYRGQPWAPTCYMVKEDLLVFEDLCSKGYSIRDKLFDETLVRAGLSAIARLHAASLLAEWRLGVPLNQLYPFVNTFMEKIIVHKSRRMWFEAGVDAAAAVAEHLGRDSDLVRSACKQIYHAFRPSCTKTNVLSHGDLWGNNLMFNNDTPPKCLLVDYQLSQYSPLAHDVTQFLYLCTDRSFRKTRESAMLRYYYETLCEILNAHEICDTQRPVWSEVVDGIEEQRLGAVITAALIFPTVLLNKEVGARIMNDPVSYAEHYFQNRKKFVLLNMKKDPVYERRISETIIELAELASQLDQLPKPS